MNPVGAGSLPVTSFLMDGFLFKKVRVEVAEGVTVISRILLNNTLVSHKKSTFTPGLTGYARTALSVSNDSYLQI